MAMNILRTIDPADTSYAEARGSRRKWIIIAVVVLAAVAVFAFMRHGSGAKPADPAKEAAAARPRVTVIVPGRTLVAGTINATGTLAARVDMPVGISGEGGRVERVLVEPGTWVKAGQTLATIDRSVQTQQAAQLAAQIRAADADADLAQSQLDRSLKLVDRGFISRADIDQKTANRDAARARVAVARAQLGQTRAQIARLDVRAPAAGLVLTRAVEPGQIVSSGSGALFRIARGGEMELQARLAESDLARLHIGGTAEVTPVGSTRAYEGRIWQLSPVVDPTSRQGIARIAVAYQPEVRPGGFAQAVLTAGTANVPLLPNSAVQSDDKGNYVYVIDKNNRALRRDVKVGDVTDKGAAILAGLSGQERVVLSAGAFLNPGDVVQPTRQASR